MNKDIRIYMVQKDVRQWAVALEMGMAEASLSRLLRHEVSPVKKKQITDAIDRLAEKQVSQNG